MRKSVRGTVTAAAALVAFAAFTSAAEAQACIGVPAAPGQNAVAGSVGFATGGTLFGAEIHHNAAGNAFTYTGRIEHFSFDADIDGQTSFGGGVAYDMSEAVGPEALSFCPTAGLMFTSSDFGNFFNIPVGVGFGTAFQVGEDDGFTIMPYAAPAIHIMMLTGDNSSTDAEIDVRLGATGVFGGFYAGLEFPYLLENAGENALTLKFGMTF